MPGKWLPRYELTQKSATGDHVVGHFTFGWLLAPVWLPVFRAGCYLIDEPSSWRCVTLPMLRRVAVGETGESTSDYYDDIENRAVKTLANMLGVKFIEDVR
jgi:hypothetical protein